MYKKPYELAKAIGARLNLDQTYCDCCGMLKWWCDNPITNPWKYVVKKQDKE